MILNPFYCPQYVRFEQLAPAYDSTATYSVGDYVTYEYNLYQCTTAVTTAGAFDPSKWNMVDVTDQLTDDLTIASSITGINPSITGSADGYVQGLTVYGRSEVVEGEIVSIGDSGSLAITTANADSSESSTATLTTGLPLCGIPFIVDETYTDEQGQKWIADTADVECVVKRTSKVTFDGSEDEGWSMPYDSFFMLTLSALPAYRLGYITTLCNNYPAVPSTYDFSQLLLYNSAETITTNNRLVIIDKSFTSLIDFKTHLTSNPLEVVYELATPTTQELTTSEQSALLSLKTYDSTTNLSVTDDPYIDFSYLKNTQNGRAVATAIDNAITKVLDTAY